MTCALTRRGFAAAIGTLVAGGLLARPGLARAAGGSGDALARALAETERRLGARLGVVVDDTGSGRRWASRPDERFPMCSTFKVLACGAVLARVDAGRETLERRVRFTAADLVTYSPVTKDHAGGDGMTLAALCEAAMTRSDNTAANLILKGLGGASAVTDFARSLGDTMTRLDRLETELNEAKPGDPRDTTTPAAMAADLRALVLGDRLSRESRDRLTAWMLANKTGDARLRAGLPAGWRIGDKTGSGDRGTSNDVAVIWPTGRPPLVVTVYITQTGASFDDRNRAIAGIARSLTAALDA
ncbi:class A beta-lactamase [Azospirillum sp. ST 5-10]|uniref:class A beta-lactamase n=1 Tax=unclassified Azospirillum TaxID=2630922 RepID=UPI003F4A1580